MSDTTDGSLTLRKDDMRFDQYKEFIGTYRHHVDIYVKAGAIFLAMIGTAFGFAFGGDASLRLTAAMMLFVAGASIAWISGAYFTGKWLKVMGELMSKAEQDLKLAAFPIGEFRTFARLMAYIGALLAIGSIGYLLLG